MNLNITMLIPIIDGRFNQIIVKFINGFNTTIIVIGVALLGMLLVSFSITDPFRVRVEEMLKTAFV